MGGVAGVLLLVMVMVVMVVSGGGGAGPGSRSDDLHKVTCHLCLAMFGHVSHGTWFSK